MNTLPLTFPKWSWTSSNGDATAIETIKAYQAVSFKQQTVEFSFKVWTDLVDLVYSALTQAGLNWDNKYLSYAATKNAAYHSSLTAPMFNSLCLNIAKSVNGNWKWQFDPTFNGYIGRTAFVGTGTTSNPDTVYGAYFIELARKINVLISILKNTADFSELEYISNLTFSFASTAVARPSAPMISHIHSEVCAHDADLTAHGAKHIESHSNAITTETSFLDKCRSCHVAADTRSNAVISAELEFFNYYFSPSAKASISSSTIATLERVKIPDNTLSTNITIQAIADVELSYFDFKPLEANAESSIISLADVDIRPAIVFSEAVSSISLTYDPIEVDNYPPSYVEAVAGLIIESIDNELITFMPIHIDAYAEIDVEAHIDSTSTLNSASPISVSAEAAFAFSVNAEMAAIHDILDLELNAGLELNSTTDLDSLPSLSISAESQSTALSTCNIELGSFKTMLSAVLALSQHSAKMSTMAVIPLESNTHAVSISSAVVELKGESWLAPIQTIHDLYIRQAMVITTFNTTLDIDSWKYPVHTGKNLYIRQMNEVVQANKNIII